jgi:uncharacterized protein
MRIRALTTGIFLRSTDNLLGLVKAAVFNRAAGEIFEDAGYEVQTTRIATNPWTDYVSPGRPADIAEQLAKIENVAQENGIGFLSVGFADRPSAIAAIPWILKRTSALYCSARLDDPMGGVLIQNVLATAKALKEVAEADHSAEKAFRFTAWARCPAHIPFFPASYHHRGKSCFALGLECGDLAVRAFSSAASLEEAKRNLETLFCEELATLEHLCLRVAGQFGVAYRGIDTSLAPSLDESGSIGAAFEKLGLGPFGSHGTLAIAGLITDVLKKVPVKRCGYCGLMLPVCEDPVLARRAGEGHYSLKELLLYSTVCGCGLDTIPVPGDTSEEKIGSLLLDVATLAVKLNKPLSARLLPLYGKKAGEMSTFLSPYLVNCPIFPVE